MDTNDEPQMNCYPLIRQGTRFDTVIVANGAFPEGAVALDVIHHAQRIIACDGGAEMLIARGIQWWATETALPLH